MSQNIQETHSLRKLVEDIDNKFITLPEFQRDFVWEIGKTLDLFDSIVKDIFIGAIIYGIPSFEITTRQIDNRPRKTKGRRRSSLKNTTFTKKEIEELHKISKDRFRIILDGQQRTTSLYRAIKGIDEIWFIVKNEIELTRKISTKKFADRSLEEILFEFDNTDDENRLSIRLSDVWEIINNDYFEDEIRSNFFNELRYVKKNKEEEGFDERSVFRRYLGLVKKIQNLFQAQKLLSYYKLDMSLHKFVLFFERSNNRGLQLSFIDILTAKLYDKFKLRRKIKEAELKYPELKININTIVRTIAFIISSRNSIKTGKAIKIHKSFILSGLNSKYFIELWDEIIAGYKEVNDFLFNNNFIISQNWIAYQNMLIPLLIFRKELGKPLSTITKWQSDFISYWWWASIFALRYGGSTNERVIEDALILTQIAQKEKITSSSLFSKISKSQVLNSEDLFGYTRKGNPIYKGILNLCNFVSGGIYDWSNGNKLSFNNDKLEDHHIFPQAYISSSYKEDSFEDLHTNCVINRTLIPKIQNIRIRDKAPSIYFNELKESNPEIEKALNQHFITVEIADNLLNGSLDKDYKFFLELRAEEIFKAISKVVLDRHQTIKDNYYSEPKLLKSTITIFGSYYKKMVRDQFNPMSKTIFYNNEVYSDPTDAAIKAREDLGAKESSEDLDGWKFWRYYEEKKELNLSTLKRILMLN